MEMFISYLLEHGVSSNNIISINFEDYDFYELRDPMKLNQYIKERLVPNEKNYIFFDEIQYVTDLPVILDSLFIRKNIDLYVTGSNAYMLSSEISTLISGRYIEISMLPLSFAEYVLSTGKKWTIKKIYGLHSK